MPFKMFSKAFAMTVMMFAASSAAQAQSTAGASFRVQFSVPMICKVSYQSAITTVGTNTYRLGNLREYCNSPNGYSLVVDYPPNTMKGATISIGGQSIVLNGSGFDIITNESGPRILDREIFVTPGPAGFDANQLQFNIQAMSGGGSIG